MDRKKIIGHISLLVANILFGLNTPISRSLMPEILDPYALTFLRLSGAMCLFWLASLFFEREHVPFKDIILLFFAAIFAIVLNHIPYFVGLSVTSPIDASIVITMLPIVTMIFAAIIIKEPITLLKSIGVLVGASGALLLVFNSHNINAGDSNMLGNIIIFGALISFALYLTLFKGLIMRYSPITLMKWVFLFATVISLPFCYKSVMDVNFVGLSVDTYFKIAYIVIIATFITYILIPIGQKALRPTTFSMYNYIQPIVTSLMAIAMGLDHFGIEQAISGVLVFAGVYIVTQSKSRAQIEIEKISKKSKHETNNLVRRKNL